MTSLFVTCVATAQRGKLRAGAREGIVRARAHNAIEHQQLLLVRSQETPSRYASVVHTYIATLSRTDDDVNITL